MSKFPRAVPTEMVNVLADGPEHEPIFNFRYAKFGK